MNMIEVNILFVLLTGFKPFSETNVQDFSTTQGSKIHINPYTPKISVLILLIAFHTLHIFSVD